MLCINNTDKFKNSSKVWKWPTLAKGCSFKCNNSFKVSTKLWMESILRTSDLSTDWNTHFRVQGRNNSLVYQNTVYQYSMMLYFLEWVLAFKTVPLPKQLETMKAVLKEYYMLETMPTQLFTSVCVGMSSTRPLTGAGATGTGSTLKNEHKTHGKREKKEEDVTSTLSSSTYTWWILIHSLVYTLILNDGTKRTGCQELSGAWYSDIDVVVTKLFYVKVNAKES